MPTCSAPVDCSVPLSFIVQFDADSDIAGIGVIGSFYIAGCFTVLLLVITYFSSAPDEFDNFGFSKLDLHVVGMAQAAIEAIFGKLYGRPVHARASKRTAKALQKSILVLSDQQLITGVAIGIVGLARLCYITQYHFNTIINLSLTASLAHSMTFSFVEQYIMHNIFFRTWRAIAMILFGMLLVSIWTVTGSNNWLETYGLPALCGFKNLSQGFGPPATTSLAILYWYLLRGWAYSLTVLFPNWVQGQWFLLGLTTTFWLKQICDLLLKVCKNTAARLYRQHEIIQQTTHSPNITESSFAHRFFSRVFASLMKAIWAFLCALSLFLFTAIYGIAQVWASYVYQLCWTCYTLTGSVRIIGTLRRDAVDNGMKGNENTWSFGQQLPLLMLLLPVLAMAEIFFDNPKDQANQTAVSESIPCESQESEMALFTSPSFGKTTGAQDDLQESFKLRRRVDTEQRVGMDIADARIEDGFRLQSANVSEETRREDDEGDSGGFPLGVRPREWCVDVLVGVVEGGDLRERLWGNGWFCAYCFGVFGVLSWVVVTFGI